MSEFGAVGLRRAARVHNVGCSAACAAHLGDDRVAQIKRRICFFAFHMLTSTLVFEAGNFLFFFPVQLADSGAEVLKPPRHAPKVFLFVRNHAAGAVLDAAFGVAEIAAAVLSERVERTVAEQAVEPFGKFRLMAGEILTGCILEKRIVLVVPVVHAYPSRSFSASAASGVTTAVE